MAEKIAQGIKQILPRKHFIKSTICSW
jgi:hypothetical protein